MVGCMFPPHRLPDPAGSAAGRSQDPGRGSLWNVVIDLGAWSRREEEQLQRGDKHEEGTTANFSVCMSVTYSRSWTLHHFIHNVMRIIWLFVLLTILFTAPVSALNPQTIFFEWTCLMASRNPPHFFKYGAPMGPSAGHFHFTVRGDSTQLPVHQRPRHAV